MRIEIDGNYIRESKRPNDLFLNIFKGKKLMKIYDMEMAKAFVEWYNNKKQPKKTLFKDEKIVMVVEGKPVYVGDKLIFNSGESKYVREVCEQHKFLAKTKPDWIKLWSWNIEEINTKNE